MKSLLTLILALGFTSPVLAASSVSNSHTVRHTHGHGKVTVNNKRVANGTQYNFSQTLKIDAVGENAGSHINFYGGHFYGGGWATNVENPDPFVMGGHSTQNEYVNFNDVTIIDSFEVYNFTETSQDWTLTTDNF